MSIVDHNPRYDKDIEADDPNFGKFFWFSGSMKRPKRSREVKEDEVIEVAVDIDESSSYAEDAQIEEEDTKHKGTYFKLNGSIGDSDLSEEDEEEHDGGTWFGVSVRKRRAESIQNLLKIAEPASQNLSEISEKYHENELDTTDSTIDHHNISTTPAILDESIPEDHVINQQLLEDFDAQFLEIEKLVMESFDDIDLNITSQFNKEKPKKNKRFGIDEMENNEPQSFVRTPKPNNDESRVTMKPKPAANEKPFEKKSKVKQNDIFTRRNDLDVDDDEDVPPVKPLPPLNYKNSVSKHSSKRTEDPPIQMNGYKDTPKTESPIKTKPSITVSSSDSGQKEYRIGETIHFQVSVREKKHSPNLSSDIKPSNEDKTENKDFGSKSLKNQIKIKTSQSVSKPHVSKTVAEKQYQYQNYIQQSPKQQRQKVTEKTKPPVEEVVEDLAQEQIVEDDFAVNDLDESFIDTYLTMNVNSSEKPSHDYTDSSMTSTPLPSKMNADAPRLLLKRQNMKEERNFEDSRSEMESSEDEGTQHLKRNRSFRRSIIIEDDEVSVRRRKSVGGTSVSVAFIAVNKKSGQEERVTIPQRLKGILNLLDNMVLDDESLGLYYDSVRQLHTVFWDLKDGPKNSENLGDETLSSMLNFLVVQEWPKVMLGCFKKLKAAYPHVFKEEESPETTVYYSGHLPSLLRMNRTTSEFAVSVIFDGLLRVAINFTDIHEASRQACCEDNLLSYLMDEIISEMHNIKWGKATAREMFLKSMSDLIYNCAQSYSNAAYLLEHNCVDVFTQLRDETFHIVDARKVNMTQLLTLSYLIDDNNYDIIVPNEGTIIRLLQFLDKSLEHSEHTHHDFYAAELAECLSRLSGHSSNKILVTRNSGQEILHKLLKYAYDDGERIAACNALWNLSFCREAKDILRGMSKLMNLLRELAASSNTNLHRAAAGVIWECEDKYDIKGTRAINQAEPGHVMLSYESEAQPLIIGIRDELNRKGFQVWMSSDVEERSLADIMTKGVERAAIVIVAVTRKYKLIPHAFAEVDYAHTLRKEIIPIIIDVDFVPDGWLKELINTELSFDFSRRSMFAGSLDALMDHVTSTCSQRAGVSLNCESLGSKRNSDVLSWSNADVIYWLKENQLIRSVNNAGRLNKLTGLHLIMFFDLKRESPDYYYSVLDSHLGFKDVLDTLEFTYSMDRLLGNERLI